jgi:predicted Zn-ribbon and HTH transcriptional regulator
MIAMAQQRKCEPLDEHTVKEILWDLRYTSATLESIADEYGAVCWQVDHLRRKFGILRIKEPHRCPRCKARIETAECLTCHLQEVSHGN